MRRSLPNPIFCTSLSECVKFGLASTLHPNRERGFGCVAGVAGRRIPNVNRSLASSLLVAASLTER